LFGACASPYFVFFDNRIAEGITKTGQYAIQYVARAINVYLNKVLGTNSFDYVITSDTDSTFINFGPLVEKYYSSKTDAEITGILNKILEAKIKPVIKTAQAELEASLNAFPDKFDMKLEKIASKGFFTGKKRYAVKVLENEGVRYAEPDYSITGIEVVRSSTPQIARTWLKEAIQIILDSDVDELRRYITSKESEFKKQPVEAISFPRSANNLKKYSDSKNVYSQKGTPIGVRASLLYNAELKKRSLDNYEEILEGNKMKYVYLKEPNTLRENVIAYATTLPKEFGLHKYVDYDTQWQKVFMDPLENIAKAISWSLQEESDIESLLFG